ncbi:MAG: division/cell wall cluster transcriptional repressor MraZ [Bacteroidetes bacterium SB0662_bin_6]|nr:division/cell wall cluster transcriptional repressor MraZ [Bacteroidetes bacterium SB0668_bin_1]MYE05400.1 division/cell wall cluster transcriptional repressor MraZ [Bacteroidetes bacterium SB0662_bin_6]
MASFKGQAEYSVDSKGRVAIPARMRNALNPDANNSFTITRGFEQCILLFPLDEWAKREAEIARLNTYRSEARSFVRTIMRWADEVTLDGQGRIVVPKNLISFAGLKDAVLIIGVLDRIEIWNPDVFAAQAEQEAEYSEVAERIFDMGRDL